MNSWRPGYCAITSRKEGVKLRSLQMAEVTAKGDETKKLMRAFQDCTTETDKIIYKMLFQVSV